MAEVEAAPKIIKEGVSIEEAEALKAKFEELGAAITHKLIRIKHLYRAGKKIE